MIYKAILQQRARKELLDAWIWYEEKQIGLGDCFEVEVYNSIEEIEQYPERYRERKQFFRSKKLKLFHTSLFIALTRRKI